LLTAALICATTSRTSPTLTALLDSAVFCQTGLRDSTSIISSESCTRTDTPPPKSISSSCSMRPRIM